MGNAELSSGDTNASIVPSRESAMWLMLISSGTAKANCMRVVGIGRRAMNHVAAATATIAAAMESQSNNGCRRGGAAMARVTALASVPERALRAKDKSRADWKR